MIKNMLVIYLHKGVRIGSGTSSGCGTTVTVSPVFSGPITEPKGIYAYIKRKAAGSKGTLSFLCVSREKCDTKGVTMYKQFEK